MEPAPREIDGGPFVREESSQEVNFRGRLPLLGTLRVSAEMASGGRSGADKRPHGSLCSFGL